MIPCPKCGHHNLPSFPSCSKCGAPLAGGGGANDEYARLMASRAATAKRTRTIYVAVGLLAIGLVGYKLMQDRRKNSAAQETLAFFDRWADQDKRETGSFWNCVMSSEVEINMFSTANQIQQRIESAYFTQQKTFSEHLVTECVPKAERAEQAFGGFADAPAAFAAPLEKYRISLKGLRAGVEDYAEKIKGRQGVKDVDALIQEAGNAWHAGGAPTPPGIAFEKFMHCAVPGLAEMKNTQAMLEFLADTCYKKDAVAFMTRVRNVCGTLLTDIDPKGVPSKTWKLSQTRFYEEEARQLRAWESCGKKSRKGKKADDLTEFLVAVGNYMQARADIAKAAKDIAAGAR